MRTSRFGQFMVDTVAKVQKRHVTNFKRAAIADDVPSDTLRKSPVSSSFADESPHIIFVQAHQRRSEFQFGDPKRLLQHYRH